MENVVLIIHLLLAIGLIGVVLLQRSEGGGLGMGSGGGGGGATSGRSAATALGKVTWVLAIGFIITSISLTILAAQKASGTSVLDRLGTSSAPADTDAPAGDSQQNSPLGSDLLPPTQGDNAPLTPTAD
ncbi:MAG: preprotein translocase subunit SecG [Rhodobacteraceae bacterium]|nr:preprotein translocase subunit SecG [Paracoccaceae bacterium]